MSSIHSKTKNAVVLSGLLRVIDAARQLNESAPPAVTPIQRRLSAGSVRFRRRKVTPMSRPLRWGGAARLLTPIWTTTGGFRHRSNEVQRRPLLQPSSASVNSHNQRMQSNALLCF